MKNISRLASCGRAGLSSGETRDRQPDGSGSLRPKRSGSGGPTGDASFDPADPEPVPQDDFGLSWEKSLGCPAAPPEAHPGNRKCPRPPEFRPQPPFLASPECPPAHFLWSEAATRPLNRLSVIRFPWYEGRPPATGDILDLPPLRAQRNPPPGQISCPLR